MTTNPNDDLARRILERAEKPLEGQRHAFTLPELTPEQKALIERYEALEENKHPTNADCDESYELIQEIHTFQPQWHARTLDPDGREINVFVMQPEGKFLWLTYEDGQWWRHDGWPYFSGW